MDAEQLNQTAATLSDLRSRGFDLAIVPVIDDDGPCRIDAPSRGHDAVDRLERPRRVEAPQFCACAGFQGEQVRIAVPISTTATGIPGAEPGATTPSFAR